MVQISVKRIATQQTTDGTTVHTIFAIDPAVLAGGVDNAVFFVEVVGISYDGITTHSGADKRSAIYERTSGSMSLNSTDTQTGLGISIGDIIFDTTGGNVTVKFTSGFPTTTADNMFELEMLVYQP